MNRNQAFLIADHMTQVNRKLFNPKMTSIQYVKYREATIRRLLSEDKL